MTASMVMVVVRALQSAVAVVAGVSAAWLFGDGNAAKLVAVPIGALAAVAIEYGITVAPKRSPSIRRRLDPRAVFEGVWIQNVKKVVTENGKPESNRFAILTISYADNKYSVEGTAYNQAGKEYARWSSAEPLHFSASGRSISYLWRGTVMAQDAAADDLDRTGFATVQLLSEDGGTGRVDHVSMKVTVIFNIQRVTPEVVARWRDRARPTILNNPEERDSFALDYAKRLTDSTASSSAATKPAIDTTSA